MNYEEAPGFRFYPTEEELISFHLRQKLEGRRQQELDRVIPVLYIYDYNPWDLPQLAGERCRSDPELEEWFFFIPRQEKEARGGRPSRLTTTGYWKATGSPGWVYSSDDTHRIIGLKRTMVFYQGRARTHGSGSRSGSSKTEWKMNEYMSIVPNSHHQTTSSASSAANLSQKGEFTVCRVYKKSKCLRAFDRRPAAPPTARSEPMASTSTSHHQAVDNHQQPSSSDHDHQNQPRSTVEIVVSSSGDGSSSSSSGDHATNDNTTFDLSLDGNGKEINHVGMEIDQAPLWDWDSHNWSF